MGGRDEEEKARAVRSSTAGCVRAQISAAASREINQRDFCSRPLLLFFSPSHPPLTHTRHGWGGG